MGSIVVEWQRKNIWLTATSCDFISGRPLIIGPLPFNASQLFEFSEILQKIAATVRASEDRRLRREKPVMD
jgi:hypothetical protein